MPGKAKGSVISHTKVQNMSASSAKGQHKDNRMNQAVNNRGVFTALIPAP